MKEGIRKALGLQECTHIVSGSAPLAAETRNFLMGAMPGMVFLEGYGLTETSGGVTLTEPGGGGVGRVIDGVEVRLTPVIGFEKGGEVEVRIFFRARGAEGLCTLCFEYRRCAGTDSMNT